MKRRRQEEADAIRKRNDEMRKKHTQLNKEAEQIAAKEERERNGKDVNENVIVHRREKE